LKALIVGIACAAAFAGEAAAVEIEPSIQYWASEGKTTWNHNAKPANPAFGNPTSQLTYSGMKSGIVEMGLTVRIGEWFGTGTFGSGSIDGGTLRDEDWLAGQVKFSDTDSAIRGDEIRYWMLDLGRSVFRNRRFAIAPFAGFGKYQEVIDAYGATNNLAGGAVLVSASTRVITNDATWTIFRIGVVGSFRPVERLTLSAEVAYLPVADLTSEDSHYLRGDLGPVPNIHMTGTGDGHMGQLEARYNVFKGAILSLAYRDWRFTANGSIRFGASGQSLPLNKFETTRSGARLGLGYRF